MMLYYGVILIFKNFQVEILNSIFQLLSYLAFEHDHLCELALYLMTFLVCITSATCKKRPNFNLIGIQSYNLYSIMKFGT